MTMDDLKLNTDQLIRAMAADAGSAARFGLSTTLLLWGIAAAALSFILLTGTAGVRPDFIAALKNGPIPFKLAVTLSLTASAFFLVRRAARPEDAPQVLPYAIPPIVVVVGGIIFELVVTRIDTQNLTGRTPFDCVALVALYSVCPLVAVFVALRRSAARSPAIAGVAAGLFAAGIGSSIYALHCPNDDAVFVALWYGTAIVLVTVIGALAGRRLLDW